MFVAIAIVLPIFFHMTGLGSTFLPMHIPVLIAGFIVGPVYGLAVGVVSPLLSGLITECHRLLRLMLWSWLLSLELTVALPVCSTRS